MTATLNLVDFAKSASRLFDSAASFGDYRIYTLAQIEHSQLAGLYAKTIDVMRNRGLAYAVQTDGFFWPLVEETHSDDVSVTYSALNDRCNFAGCEITLARGKKPLANGWRYAAIDGGDRNRHAQRIVG